MPVIQFQLGQLRLLSGFGSFLVATSIADSGADGWLYRLELVDCGKGASGRCHKCADGPGHGPYW